MNKNNIRNIPAEQLFINAGASPRTLANMDRPTFDRVYLKWQRTGVVPEEALTQEPGNTQQPQDVPEDSKPQPGDQDPPQSPPDPRQRKPANQKKPDRARNTIKADRTVRMNNIIEQSVDEKPYPLAEVEYRINDFRGGHRERFLRASQSLQDFVLDLDGWTVQRDMLVSIDNIRRSEMGDVTGLSFRQQNIFLNLPTLGQIRAVAQMDPDARIGVLNHEIDLAEQRRRAAREEAEERRLEQGRERDERPRAFEGQQQQQQAQYQYQAQYQQQAQDAEYLGPRPQDQFQLLQLFRHLGRQMLSQDQILEYQRETRITQSMPDLEQRMRGLSHGWVGTVTLLGRQSQEAFFRDNPHYYQRIIETAQHQLAENRRNMAHLSPVLQQVVSALVIDLQTQLLSYDHAEQRRRLRRIGQELTIDAHMAILGRQRIPPPRPPQQSQPLQQLQPPRQQHQQPPQQQQMGLQEQLQQISRVLRDMAVSHFGAELPTPTEEEGLEIQLQARLAVSIPNLEQRTMNLEEDWRLTLILIDPVEQERFFALCHQDQENMIREAQQNMIELVTRMAHLPPHYQRLLRGERMTRQIHILGLSPDEQLLWLEIREMGLLVVFLTDAMEQRKNNGQSQAPQQAPQAPQQEPQVPQQAPQPPQQGPQPPAQHLQQEQPHPDVMEIDIDDIPIIELRAMREGGWGPNEYNQWVAEGAQARWHAEFDRRNLPRK
ncbi:hypothetical protein E4T38_09125 [Aureobasidium subglaciale]|nr:hypothetical protein E4T38_09125 [Aureobasidium subglaciale]